MRPPALPGPALIGVPVIGFYAGRKCAVNALDDSLGLAQTLSPTNNDKVCTNRVTPLYQDSRGHSSTFYFKRKETKKNNPVHRVNMY